MEAGDPARLVFAEPQLTRVEAGDPPAWFSQNPVDRVEAGDPARLVFAEPQLTRVEAGDPPAWFSQNPS